MRSRCHWTGSAAERRFSVVRSAGWGKLLLGLLLLLALPNHSAAQPGVFVGADHIDFGDQTVNGPGADNSVGIQNRTSGPVQISFMTNGADPQDFVPRANCPGALAAGASCTIHVIFTPSQSGYRSAVLVVTTDAQPPIMVPLSGVGVPGTTGGTSGSTTGGTTTGSTGGTTGGAPPQNLPIHCPPNQTVPLDAGSASAHLLPGVATSSAGARVFGVRSDGKALTDAYPAGTTTITWIATADGSAGSCTQTITVGSPSIVSAPSSFVGPGSADPEIEGIAPDHGPLYQRAIIHGSGFADTQGTSHVLLGGRPVAVLAWSAGAIAVMLNPLAFDPSPLALNASYPVQVLAPASGRQSNTVGFFLADGPPESYPDSGGNGPTGHPRFASFQRSLFCPGDTVVFMGTGFGATQGSGYLALTVPLADPSGNVVGQVFAVPVLSWSENAISFTLNLPAGAIPGTYTVTIHHSSGKTASGDCTVGARTASGDCAAGN